MFYVAIILCSSTAVGNDLAILNIRRGQYLCAVLALVTCPVCLSNLSLHFIHILFLVDYPEQCKVFLVCSCSLILSSKTDITLNSQIISVLHLASQP
jgi:hypothetical protein